MGGRAGSPDLSLAGHAAVLACAVDPVLGVEERRDLDVASRGGGAAPRQPQAQDRLDGPGAARRAGPGPAHGAAGVPDRHPGNTPALAPPYGDQEMDPA